MLRLDANELCAESAFFFLPLQNTNQSNKSIKNSFQIQINMLKLNLHHAYYLYTGGAAYLTYSVFPEIMSFLNIFSFRDNFQLQFS